MTGPAPDLELVVPAHDEERLLATTVGRLVESLRDQPFSTVVTVVDSGSTDATWDIARRLADAYPTVRAVRVTTPGRGLALRTAWTGSGARYVGYTDADLSADPSVIATMIAALDAHDADVMVGSRLEQASSVTRRLHRELISRCYSDLLTWTADPGFRDPQCGFKIMRTAVCDDVLGDVVDDEWFFDTEFLLRARGRGWTIVEVPITWTERRESRVRLLSTAWRDLRGLARLTLPMLGGGDRRGLVGARRTATPTLDAAAALGVVALAGAGAAAFGRHGRTRVFVAGCAAGAAVYRALGRLSRDAWRPRSPRG